MASIASLGVGSGLDLNGLLNQLESAERQRLQPLAVQKASFQSQISAYGKLEGTLSQFQNSLAQLGKAETFAAVKSNVFGDAFSAAANSEAVPGRYSIAVEALAKSYSSATIGLDDKARELGAGDIDITLANGDTHTISIAADASSLDQVRDGINAAQNDVVASVINDGDATSPYRLVIHSAKTGEQASVSNLSFNGFGGELTSDSATVQAGTNARFTVNGLTVESASNQVEEAIQGVTLNLSKAGETSELAITRDSNAIEKSVKDFIKSYNSLNSTVRDLGSYNAETQSGGRLLGDSSLRMVQSELRSIFSETVVESSSFTFLSELGIARELDGSLTVDDEKLATVTNEQLGDLTTFFTGQNEQPGFSSQAKTVIDRLLDENGVISTSTEGMKSAITRIDERIAREEISIGQTVERYRTQFAQLDSMIANMNSTSSYLTQQFDSLNAQLGRK
ncbi:Flagellar hook-associated protein 2 [Pseudidiomarina piscicola]|uniref:Flagellar hook-associated protein 2 n=1 Tax=Pseudidiomarina piscicola TaxID=2614830 RepID=A0A6S6WLY6_9GAMM|nr:flagellar filament capping protein FliD [Pseudidiomarina piscicola]CAB0151060.1 Flagellar hook-associated protein 2 [Pseudidiomarina piscicola]VZT40570.1 Flagellar hook-associated protein 2 [Pseudomonas aeruginosa]